MEPQKIFTKEEAENFFEKNSFKFPENLEIQKSIGCIDDRDPNNRIAIPGSSLGFYMAVFGALDKLKFNIENKDELCEIIHSVVGGLIHTDEKNSEEKDASPVAGCGHCNGILKRKDISQGFEDFLNNIYLKKLEMEMGEALVYKGSHSAKGVFVINDLNTGLISNDGTDHVYVYNKAFHEKLSDELIEKLYPFLQKINPNVSKEQFSESLKKTSEEQLKKTLDHLTKGLPYFER